MRKQGADQRLCSRYIDNKIPLFPLSATLRHNKYTRKNNATVSKGTASAILTPLVLRGWDSNPPPTSPEADALPLELSGQLQKNELKNESLDDKTEDLSFMSNI